MKYLYRFSALAFVIAFSTLVTSTTHAQGVRVGSHVGVNFEGTDFLLGLNSHFDLYAGDTRLVGNPNLDFYLFEDEVSIYAINLDVLLPFQAGELDPFLGGGLAVRIAKFDQAVPILGGSTDSDIGLNLKAGTFFGNRDNSIRPFVDGTFAISDNSSFTLRVGASFGITG